MSIYMGLDPSLGKFGIARIRDTGELIDCRAFPTANQGATPAGRMARIGVLLGELSSIVNAKKPEFVMIEGYSMGSKGGRITDLAELGGLVRYFLWNQEISMMEVAPSTLKKWASGKGNSQGKTEVITRMVKDFGVEFEFDDQYDAYALARMARQFHLGATLGENVPKFRIEVIEKLKSPVKKTTRKKKSAIENQ